jgi:hypothetical protein
MSQSVVWAGRSGMEYSLVAQPLDSQVGCSGGVYILARRNVTGDGWVAICVGETDRLSQVLPANPKLQCARDHAATHVHLLPHEDEAARRAIVRDLIARWHPPCNQTLVDTIASPEHVVISG